MYLVIIIHHICSEPKFGCLLLAKVNVHNKKEKMAYVHAQLRVAQFITFSVRKQPFLRRPVW